MLYIFWWRKFRHLDKRMNVTFGEIASTQNTWHNSRYATFLCLWVKQTQITLQKPKALVFINHTLNSNFLKYSQFYVILWLPRCVLIRAFRFLFIWQQEFLPFHSSFAPPPALLHSLLSLAKDLVREAVDANEIFRFFMLSLSTMTMDNQELTVQKAENAIRH